MEWEPVSTPSSDQGISYKMNVKIHKTDKFLTKLNCLNHKLAKIVENKDHYEVSVDSADR